MHPVNQFKTGEHYGYPSHIIVPDGYFLNDSIPFNYRLTTGFLNEYSAQLYSRISANYNFYNVPAKIQAINSIISNALTSFFNNKSLAYSRNKNNYPIPDMYGMYHYTYTNIIRPIDWLIQNYYLGQANGFYNSNKKERRNSRIWATIKLIEEIDEFIFCKLKSISNEDLIRQLKYNSPIVLKNKEKSIIDCPINQETIKMKKFLTEYNEFINSQKIILPVELSGQKNHSGKSDFLSSYFSYSESIYLPNSYYNIHIPTNIIIQLTTNTTTPPLLSQFDSNSFIYKDLNAQLYRVFNVNLKQGGRFYGGEYQGLPEEVRKSIIINDQKVIELDYSSLHLTMLYHLTGIDYKEDPYLAINSNPDLRSLYKLISLIIINSNSKANALRGFNTEVFKDSKKKNNRRFHKEKLENYNLSFSDLYNQFVDTHKELEPYFLSGIGIKLQNIDSMIAERIMKHCLKSNIPCLSVHDSFIVSEKYKEELERVMIELYKKHLRTEFNPVIK